MILNKFKNLPEKLKFFSQHKITFILVALVLIVVVGGFFVFKRFISTPDKINQLLPEVDLAFDPEGPYAILTPRRDGNALVLNLMRTASYDKISYELAYQSEGIDRGVIGDINTQDKKSQYDQEILFGTCSKNVCKYDTGVENGTLTLHIRKGNLAYRMITQWHLQKPSVALGALTSGDGHFTYKIDPKASDLSLILFTITNDLSGAPKLPTDKNVSGKVYAINTPLSQTLPLGTIAVELASTPSAQAKIAKFDESQDSWQLLDSKITNTTLSAQAPKGGIFTVLVPKQ